jgi:phosphopantetheine adenylyltransferase
MYQFCVFVFGLMMVRVNRNVAEFKDEAQTAVLKDPVRTALQTLFISVIKTNQFML